MWIQESCKTDNKVAILSIFYFFLKKEWSYAIT